MLHPVITKHLDLERPIVLVVSALSPSKQVDLAIKGVSKMPKGSLVVLGKGETEALKGMVTIKFVGRNFGT